VHQVSEPISGASGFFVDRVLHCWKPLGVFRTVMKKQRGSTHGVLNADSTVLYGILAGVKSPMKRVCFIAMLLAFIPSNSSQVLEALRENKTLTTLDMGDSSIGGQGAEHMARALRENKTRTTLHMRDNNIGDQGKALLSKHGDRVKF
jgi:hypothetical protein